MVVGVLWGTFLNQLYYDEALEAARVEVLGERWTEQQAVDNSKAISKAVESRLKDTFPGGAAFGLAGLFLNLLKMVMIPLVFSSLICGVVGMRDFKKLGRVGGRTGLWYLGTTLAAVLTGLLLVNLLGPGVGVELTVPERAADVAMPDSAWDVLTDMVPINVVGAAADGKLLPLIFFTILFGIFLLRSKPDTRAPVERFFQGLFDVMMNMTMFIIRLAPVGIAALVAKLLATTGPEVFVDLAGYAGTVAAALAIHVFGSLPLLFWIRTRRNPYKVMRAMSPALLTAFSTASSAGTLPVTMERVEHGVGVSNQISSFVLPLGATVNMDGTALYECVATIFIAQIYATAHPEFALGFGAQLTIVALALLVSIGAAGIPHAGLVMMVIIFEAVGLPVALTGLLWAIDRPLDMARTMTNVWSDTLGTVYVAHSVGEVDEETLFERETPPTDPEQAS